MVIQVGDTLPSSPVQEGAIDSSVDLSKEIKNGYIILVPAAFSPTCSQGHIPKYVTASQQRGSSDIFVVSVNDAFVSKAWQENLDPDGKSGVRFFADPHAEFVKGVGLLADVEKYFGNKRAHRSAIVVKDGKVSKVEQEPEPLMEVTNTSADKILA